MNNKISKMQSKEYHVSSSDLERKLSQLVQDGVTELVISDPSFTTDKKKLLSFLNRAEYDAPNLHFVFALDSTIIDSVVCNALSSLFCSLHFLIKSDFDKRLLTKKATLLNNTGLVFGYDVLIGGNNDNLKLFRSRLDFLLSLYPNHIDFPPLEENTTTFTPTSFFSKQDYMTALRIAFSCFTFYTSGRAVPWFLTILAPLKMTPCRFFLDFAEWQQCNNCSMATSFDPSSISHLDLEKMQLNFMQQKYEEKGMLDIFSVVSDLVRLHGAFSRIASDAQESTLKLSWAADDLLSPEVFDLIAFYDEICMSPCTVRVFDNGDGPDFRII